MGRQQRFKEDSSGLDQQICKQRDTERHSKRGT